jgi:hypothetical protein
MGNVKFVSGVFLTPGTKKNRGFSAESYLDSAEKPYECFDKSACRENSYCY